MRTTDLRPGILCLPMCLLITACYASEDYSSDGALDVDANMREVSVDCIRDLLSCDLIYSHFVTFTFTDTSTGESYCGPAAISFLSECDHTGGARCECVDGSMHGSGDPWTPCHVNPPEGETSTIIVSVDGYRDFIQDVTLPWECHPTAEVDVLLEPL